jgi:tetratricopeptide (TPR) repeat protein
MRNGRSIIAWIVLLLGTFAQAALPAQQETAAAAYRKANAHFDRREFEQSLAAVEEALRLDPRFVPALTLKARLAMAANRYEIARECLERAVELEPQTAGVHFLLGFCRYVENDFKGALSPLERAAQLKPENGPTQFYLAMTLEALGRTDEAIAAYENTLKLEKSGAALADPLVAYARLLFTQGRYGESEKLIDRALGVEPTSRDGYYEKGRLLMERREYTKAIEHGKKALSLAGEGTTDAQIHFLLARAYQRTGQNELAASHLAKHRAAPQSLRR